MKSILELFKQTFKEWSEDKAPRLAAALSYYTAFSLAPILVIALWVVNFFYGDIKAGQTLLLDEIGGLAGKQSQELVGSMLEAAQDFGGDTISVVVGVVALIFGATGVFGQLEDSLNTIWEVAPKPKQGILKMIKDRFLSFTMVLGVGFLLLVSLVMSALLTALGNWTNGLFPGWEIVMQVVNFVVSFLVITLLFALIFKYVPDAKVRWRDIWLGAAFTALLFTLGKFLIGLYLGNSSSIEQFGAAGSLVVILLWVYYFAQISFFGAEFTQVYANKYGQKIVPSESAVPLTEDNRAQQGIPRKEKLSAAAEQNVAVTQVSGSQKTFPATRSPVSPPVFVEERTTYHPPVVRSVRLVTSLVAVLVTVLSGFVLGLISKSKK
jgi:membrane protein